MKFFFYALLLSGLLNLFVVTQHSTAQTIIKLDDFSQPFPQTGGWTGDTNRFIIEDNNGNPRLRINADNTTTSSAITLPELFSYGSLELEVTFGFSGLSGSNRLNLFFASSNSYPDGTQSGYVLQGGETGTADVFKLYRVTNGSNSLIGADTTLINNGGTFRLKIDRDTTSTFTVSVGRNSDGELHPFISVNDSTFTQPGYISIQLLYTSTRATSTSFDNIRVSKYRPFLTRYELKNRKQIALVYSDSMNISTAQPTDFVLEPGQRSPQELQTSGNTVTLLFDDELPYNSYSLSIPSLSDRYGLQSYVYEIPVFVEAVYESGDIYLSEFMHNPPSGLLDYIEIFNSSAKRLSLADWYVRDNTSTQHRVPGSPFIEPESYVVLTADSTALFQRFGSRNYILMNSFPGLNNTSRDQVRIYSNNGSLVDSTEYEPSWGSTGFALERRRFDIPAYLRENWGASPNSVLRGSPGLPNEIEQDNTAPAVQRVQAIAADTISLVFTETVQEPEFSSLSTYTLTNGISVSAIQKISSRELKLMVTPSLTPNTPYTLSIGEIEDIFGNRTSTEITLTIEFILAAIPNPGEISITEFLYDPPSGYTEFIELFNNSDNVFDLKDFTYNDNSGVRRVITTESHIFRPGTYVSLVPNISLLGFFPDATFINMGSAFSSLNNSGDHIVIRSNEGELLDSLAYSSSWGGDNVSLERKEYSVPAYFSENWGDAVASLFATPGAPNSVEKDRTPPGLMSAKAVSTDSIHLQFNERLNPDEALLLTNYQLNQGVRINTAQLRNEGRLVVLGLNPKLQENTLYEGSLIGLADIFGNSIESEVSFSLEFVETEAVSPGDIAITEFLYDPPTGYSEFIEIKNVSEKFLDLSNWTYNDNSGSPKIITEEQTILKPGAFAVLSADDKLDSFFPDIPLIIMGSNFASLNNTTDQIVLKNASGVTLDSLEYNSGWGGTDKSLERRTTAVSSVYSENWGDSPSVLWASPGAENSIEADSTPPEVVSVSADSTKLYVVFSERLKPGLLESAVIENSLNRTEKQRTITAALLEIEFNVPLTQSVSFTVTIPDLEDLFGNIRKSQTREVSFVIVKQPLLGDMLISEFVYKSSESVPEFIELFNTTNENLDLRNLRIADTRETLSLSFRPGFINYLPANSYLAITTDDGFANSGEHRTAVTRLPSLNDTGSDAIVVKTESITLDSVSYEFPVWPAAEAGQSFERKSFSRRGIDPINWGLQPNRRHTAGKANEIDANIPNLQLVFAGWIQPDTLEVIFNQYLEPEDVIEITLNGNPIFPTVLRRNILYFALPESQASITETSLLTVKINNSVISESFPLAIRLENEAVKPLILTEILYNPLNTDEIQQGGFIEWFNPNPFAVGIPTTLVRSHSVNSGSSTSLDMVANGIPMQMKAKSYAILTADTTQEIKHSRVWTYFELNDSIQVFRTNRTTLSLSSENAAVTLRTSTGIVLDSVHYSASWHNPNVADIRGRSLERILLSGSSIDPTNWSTSGSLLGGTPGKQNTLFIDTQEATENSLLISPNPFSPDFDGFEDNTTISWNLDGTNYLLSAVIYDRFGRKVRTLTERLPAGKTGSLIWDGKRDDGTANRIGIYILLFKAQDASNGKEIMKKETIVIATKL